MILKCEKGKHYYNAEIYAACPFCAMISENNQGGHPIQGKGDSVKENPHTALTETETITKQIEKN